ncbi:phosphatidate cytidylyltransferase related protein [Cyclospora cayetanensis]|uniref:Phosphatidate cytidylyltransferase related protein n=1 Tax=Cyclospora cayetanensis TaxID=88456 RepID=A0A1D3D7T8_9EIME|nr:phosphatidate cytidylyltransferase related protein [Cyclospora cayetanensis]
MSLQSVFAIQYLCRRTRMPERNEYLPHHVDESSGWLPLSPPPPILGALAAGCRSVGSERAKGGFSHCRVSRGLLYVPSVACFTLYCIALLAAFEHVKLRNAALQRLEDWCTRAHRKLHAEASAERQHTASEGTHGNCTQGMQTEFHGFSRHAYASWLVVSFSAVAVSILTYAWRSEIPESHEALLYAWASAGFDLYFLCHFAVPLAMGSFVLRRNAGLPLAASLIAISAAGDTGALFCGSAFGHRRIIKRLSPNKTLAGVIGSLLFSWLTAALLWHLAQSYPALSVRALPLEDYLTIGALVCSVATREKEQQQQRLLLLLFLHEPRRPRKPQAARRAHADGDNVDADSSSIFGPHGGMLDRVILVLCTFCCASSWTRWFCLSRRSCWYSLYAAISSLHGRSTSARSVEAEHEAARLLGKREAAERARGADIAPPL